MNKLLISAILLLIIVSCQTNDDVECANSDLSFTTTIAEAHCTNDGSIEISVTGGEAPYSYFIDDGSGLVETTQLIENLFEGDYLVEVKDKLGCSFSTNVTVNSLNTLSVAIKITNADCGLENGMIDILHHTSRVS